MEMEEDRSSNRKKRQDFHQSIRRQQIDNHFHQIRRKIIQHNIMQRQQLLQEQLNTIQKQEGWVRKQSEQMFGQPKVEWRQVLEVLVEGVRFFKGDFDIWEKQGIFTRICELFKQDYWHLKLGGTAAKILSQVLHSIDDQRMALKFIEQILKNEFDVDLIALCDCLDGDVSETIEQVILLAEMGKVDYRIRDHLVRNGMIQVIVNLANSNHRNIEFRQIILWTISVMLKIHDKSGISVYPPRNLLQVFVPILDRLIQTPSSDLCLTYIYFSLESIVRQNKEVNFANLFNAPNIPKSILNHIDSNKIEIRKKAIFVCSYLFYSKNKTAVKQFVSMGVLDKLLEARRLSEGDDITITSIVDCLRNIAGNTDEDQQILLEHKIFGVILQCTHPSTRKGTLSTALYTLNTMCMSGKFRVIQFLVKKAGVIQIFMRCIEVHKLDGIIVKQSIQGLFSLIKFYQTLISKNGDNQILRVLMKIYNFETVLMDLNDNCKNRSVRALVDSVIQFINVGDLQGL